MLSPQVIRASAKPAQQRNPAGFMFGPWRLGTFPTWAPGRCTNEMLSDSANLILLPDGAVRTRPGLETVCQVGAGTIRGAKYVLVGGTWYTVFWYDNMGSWRMDACSGGSPALVVQAPQLQNMPRVVPVNNVALILDGEYPQVWNSGGVILGYDNGTDETKAYQFNYRDNTEGITANVGDGTTEKVGKYFTTASWVTGRDVPPTEFFVKMQRRGEGYDGYELSYAVDQTYTHVGVTYDRAAYRWPGSSNWTGTAGVGKIGVKLMRQGAGRVQSSIFNNVSNTAGGYVKVGDGTVLRVSNRVTTAAWSQSRQVYEFKVRLGRLGTGYTGANPLPVYFRVRKVSTDAIVAEKQLFSDIGDVNAVNTEYTFTLASADTLTMMTASTQYDYCIEYEGGDTSNCLKVYYDTGSTGSGYNFGYTSEVWTQYTTPFRDPLMSVSSIAAEVPVYARVRRVSDDAIMAEKVLVQDTLDVSTTGSEWWEVDLADADTLIGLSPSTAYYVGAEMPVGSADGSNYIKVRCGNVGTGGLLYTYAGSSWTNDATKTPCVKLWVNHLGGPVTFQLYDNAGTTLMAEKEIISQAANVADVPTEYSIIISSGDINYNMTPGAGHYAVVAYTKGSGTDCVMVVRDTATNGSISTYNGSIWATINSVANPIMALKPGMAPKLKEAVVWNNRVYGIYGEWSSTDAGKIAYSGANDHLDWSTSTTVAAGAEGGGEFTVAGSGTTAYPIGGLKVWNNALWVFGTPKHPFLKRVTGNPTSGHVVEDINETVSGRWLSLVEAGNNIWFMHPNGADMLQPTDTYGDIQSNSIALGIKDTVRENWVETPTDGYGNDVIAGYVPEWGIVLVKFPADSTTYAIHTQAITQFMGRPIAPIMPWTFTLPNGASVSSIDEGPGYCFIGAGSVLYRTQIDYEVYDYSALYPISFSLETANASTRFGEASAWEVGWEAWSDEQGGNFDISWYLDHMRDTAIRTDTINLPTDFDAAGGPFLDRFQVNWNYRAIKAKIDNVTIGTGPIIFRSVMVNPSRIGGL